MTNPTPYTGDQQPGAATDDAPTIQIIDEVAPVMAALVEAMTEGKQQPAEYGHAARMRVALSATAQDLIYSAAQLVPTRHDRPGELLANARQLADLADYLRTIAVAYEHAAGASWATIGETLGISRQAAHERYGKRTGRYERGTLLNWLMGDSYPAGLPDGAQDTAEHAARLDGWLTNRCSPSDYLPGSEHSVTGGLEPLTLAEEAALLTRAAPIVVAQTNDPAVTSDEACRLQVALCRRVIGYCKRRLATESGLTDDDRTAIHAMIDTQRGNLLNHFELAGHEIDPDDVDRIEDLHLDA